VVHLHTNCDPEQQLGELGLDEPVEPESVALTDAIADPRAVMVMGRHTVITTLAMLAP
jgi:hypothetical protein